LITRRAPSSTLFPYTTLFRSEPLVVDVGVLLHQIQSEGKNLLFEGAQGTLLDVDHGTYPYVTSSNTTAGAAATGSGVGPRDLHRSEEHTSELQSRENLVCRLL